MRVTPASRSAASRSAVTDAGAISTVHSAIGPPLRSRTIAPSRARSPGASSPGVPPPQNTVVTGRVHATRFASLAMPWRKLFTPCAVGLVW